MNMNSPQGSYSERLSVGFTREQIRQMDELIRVRARSGQWLTKSDLIRDAFDHYLQQQVSAGHPAPDGLERRVSEVDVKIEAVQNRLEGLIEWLEQSVKR